MILGHRARLGGSAYLATVVNQVRAQDPQHTMLLDAGDSVHGTAATDLDEGLSMAEVMNTLGYDVGTIGNHDFQWGVPALESRLQKNAFDNVIANVREADGSPLPNTHPYVVKDMGGVKVGVMGILTHDTLQAQRTERLEGAQFLDEAETVAHYLPQMKQDGAELTVLLTHEGLVADEKLAAQMTDQGVLFIGGHSHDRVKGAVEVNGNYVVQAGSMGKEVGLLEVDYDRAAHRVVGVRHQLIPLDTAKVAPDPKVKAVVEKYLQAADEELGKVWVHLPHPLTRSNHTDSSLGNLVTDAMRAMTGAQVALINSDGLRADLPGGKVRLKDLYGVIPFGGELLKGSIRGQDLWNALERSISMREVGPDTQSGFLQVSGLHVEYDASRPAGQRLLKVDVGDSPLDPNASYSIALEDYLNAGKLGYDPLKGHCPQDTSMTILDAFRDHLKDAASRRDLARVGRIVDRTPAAGMLTPSS